MARLEGHNLMPDHDFLLVKVESLVRQYAVESACGCGDLLRGLRHTFPLPLSLRVIRLLAALGLRSRS